MAAFERMALYLPVQWDTLAGSAARIQLFNNRIEWISPGGLPPGITVDNLLDLQSAQEGLPNNLGMGIEYWNAAGVNIPNLNGGFINGDNLPDAIYVWNGLTLFDNVDPSGTTDVNAPNYSELLQSIDALGGKLNPALNHKLVDRSKP